MKEFGDAKPEGEKKEKDNENESVAERAQDAEVRKKAFEEHLRRVGKPEDEIREDD